MSAPVFVYETTDTDFANRAIDAMRAADIPCYRTGRGYSSDSSYSGRGITENQVCIYIDHDSDYERANALLIQLGAVIEKPIKVPAWVLFGVGLVAAALAALAVYGLN